VRRKAGRGRLLALALVAGCALVATAPASARVLISTRITGHEKGRAIPRSFLGISSDWNAVYKVVGNARTGPDYVYRQLLQNVAAYGGGMPTLRVGGDYADAAWWNPTSQPDPYQRGVFVDIKPDLLAGLASDARDLGQRMILGINLGARDVALARDKAKAILAAIPRRNLLALEIGNEPDDYTFRIAYEEKDAAGRVVKRVYLRGRSYNGTQYLREWDRVAGALRKLSPRAPLAGMAGYGQIVTPQRFIAHERRRLAFYTEHAYPMTACDRKGRIYKPGEKQYPTIAKLLGPVGAYTTVGQQKRGIAAAHRFHKRYVVDEMNSVSCYSRAQVSGGFAATLWAVDQWFLQVALGVDAINMHIDSPVKTPFQFSIVGPQSFAASANPLYYAMLAFAATAGRGGRLLYAPTVVARTKANARVWAVKTRSGYHVLVINKDLKRSGTARIALARSTRVGRLARLSAPSISATSGVSFAGQAVASPTFDGKLQGTPRSQAVRPRRGVYTFTMPRASAALLTIG
jgi:hypothetical protein